MTYWLGHSTLIPVCDSTLSSAVADGGQWAGCVSSHAHTNRLLVWETLENFFATVSMDEAKTKWMSIFKQD